MNKIFLQNDNNFYLKIFEVLGAGGIVMHPTETCYGLAVDISNEKAIEKLYKMKKMDLNKPVSILCANLDMAREYGEFSAKALSLAEKYWPGPLSILVPRTEKLPNFFNEGYKFVSIRVSSDDFCSKMVQKFGRPVSTTSANVSGQPELYSVDLSQFGEKDIDLVVDGGGLEKNMPSTIVKVKEGEVFVLRKGDINLE